MKKSFNSILKKISKNKAMIMTSSEISSIIKSGKKINLNDIDIVTTGTCGLMSGTYAIFSFSLKKIPSFKKAKKIYMNGIEGFIGPCPNENLNIVDVIIFGTATSTTIKDYGSGHLFKDLVSNKKIDLVIYTNENKIFNIQLTIDNINFSKLISTRNSFKNYRAFVNNSDENIKSIFHPYMFQPYLNEATVSGCGQINPLKNDSNLKCIGIGTKVLVNGSEGYIIGLGTRSTFDNPNLMIISDMKKMNPFYMGGFITSMGIECIVSISIPLLNINNSLSEDVFKLNDELILKIASVDNRKDIGSTFYNNVWDNTDDTIKVDKSKCLKCSICNPILYCPCKAISRKNDILIYDYNSCFNCGYCTTICNGNVFHANLGTLKFNYKNKIQNIPIVCRQSSISKAKKIESELKEKINNHNFKVTLFSEHLS